MPDKRDSLFGPIDFLASAASLCLLLLAGCHKEAAPVIPPLNVDTAAAVVQTVPVFGEWVATLDGMVDAQIQPQVGGYVISQDYKEGSEVHKGQVLFEIDPRPGKPLKIRQADLWHRQRLNTNWPR